MCQRRLGSACAGRQTLAACRGRAAPARPGTAPAHCDALAADVASPLTHVHRSSGCMAHASRPHARSFTCHREADPVLHRTCTGDLGGNQTNTAGLLEGRQGRRTLHSVRLGGLPPSGVSRRPFRLSHSRPSTWGRLAPTLVQLCPCTLRPSLTSVICPELGSIPDSRPASVLARREGSSPLAPRSYPWTVFSLCSLQAARHLLSPTHSPLTLLRAQKLTPPRPGSAPTCLATSQ